MFINFGNRDCCDRSQVEENISRILEKITFKELDSKLINKNDYNWYPRECIRNVTFNMIYYAMFGRILMLDDKKYQRYHHSVQDVMLHTNFAVLYLISSSILKLIWLYPKNQFVGGMTRLKQMMTQDVNDLIQKDGYDTYNYRLSDNPNTLVESVCSEYLAANDNKLDKLTFKRLIIDLVILFIAGIDTTAHTAEVGVLLLAKYPHIQETVHKVKHH